MQKLILTRGIPGSGKSTWAKQYIEGHTNCVRVNRDSLRWMIYDAPYTDRQGLEKLIRRVEDRVVKECLDSNYDVVLDNTHCNIQSITDWMFYVDVRNVVKTPKIQLVIVDFPISVREACERDKLREHPVGLEVIKTMQGLLKCQKKDPDYLTVQKLVVESRELSK